MYLKKKFTILQQIIINATNNIKVKSNKGWCVALSGGTDSLALTAVASKVYPTTALIVDHGIYPNSNKIAKIAYKQAINLGCVKVKLLKVKIKNYFGGIEAAAREVRYKVLQSACKGLPVLLAHTLDDQAETVLLGLGRGSGTRSIAGMKAHDPPWHRPLIGVRRILTKSICIELNLIPWEDPHNYESRFARSKLRHRVFPSMKEILGGGVSEALARTAVILREDTYTLDLLAKLIITSIHHNNDKINVTKLRYLPDSLRLRIIRNWLLASGACDLNYNQVKSVDQLITCWHGQDNIAIGSGLRKHRFFIKRYKNTLIVHIKTV